MLETPTKRIVLNIPVSLLKYSDEVAAQLNTTRSELIRESIKEYVKKVSNTNLKRRLAEGYKANAPLLKQTSEEFKFVDAENL